MWVQQPQILSPTRGTLPQERKFANSLPLNLVQSFTASSTPLPSPAPHPIAPCFLQTFSILPKSFSLPLSSVFNGQASFSPFQWFSSIVQPKMTVGWLLQLINPDGSNRDQDTQGPISPTQNTKLVQPIISSGNIGLGPLPPRDVLQDEDIPPPPPQFIPSNNGFFHRDYDKDLSLPVFSADYPAFFILVLLVTLTTFAMFVLLFLCCLDGDDLVIHLQQDVEAVPPEPEPPFKEVGTETDFSDEPEAPAEMETQTEEAAEEDDTVVIIAAEAEAEAATETSDA